MKITYGLTKETYTLGAIERTAYGIAAYSDSKDDGTATVIARICDLSWDRERVKQLVKRCNRLRLSPIHLHDVVEDFLAE